MRLYSWNVNGIRSVWRSGHFAEWLRTTSPEVVCLQETRASIDQIPWDLLRPEGYESHWGESPRKGYAGVATYSRLPIVGWRAGSLEAFDSESRILITDFGEFELYNIYFPNSGMGPHRLQYKLDFYAALLAHVDAEVAAGRSVIIAGDLNTAHQPIDIARPMANQHTPGFLPEERAALDLWADHGWVDTFRHLYPERQAYTWWSQRIGARSRNIGWRLDYFLVHQRFLSRVRDAGMSPEVYGSDHCPVWLDLG